MRLIMLSLRTTRATGQPAAPLAPEDVLRSGNAAQDPSAWRRIQRRPLEMMISLGTMLAFRSIGKARGARMEDASKTGSELPVGYTATLPSSNAGGKSLIANVCRVTRWINRLDKACSS